MPELPEVESIRKQLEMYAKGHHIESVEVKNRRIFQGEEGQLIGAKMEGFRRFGKVTIIDLDNGKSMMIHVKMTGQLIYKGPNLDSKKKVSPKVVGGVPGVHTHVIFDLDHGGKLYYNDLRRFGWVKVVDTKDVETTDLVGKMGPEPHFEGHYAGHSRLTLEYFREVLSKTKRAIKVVIMDQAKIGGVGNIYANDALYLSKIDPKRPASSLTESEQQLLFDSIHEVLKEGMKHGGSSENSFVTPDGGEGEYQRHTLVYGKQGELCKVCGKEKIKKNMLGGRGTYFCSFCQK